MLSHPPLNGLRVLEFAGLAPGPFCGQLLSSNGAIVLRIDRPSPHPTADILTSYKSSLSIDLKDPSSFSLLTSLLPATDILIDPFRPGVLEKLGLSPDFLLRTNPRLIIVRLTGFRRDGKYKDMAGHDINYLAVSGVLSMLGGIGVPPSPPGNLLADYAGGGLVAFAGVLLALLSRNSSGKGQVVEANMVDGVSYIGTIPRLRRRDRDWKEERGSNMLDGGAPYYGCYECRDGGYMAIGPLESRFFEQLLKGMELKMEDAVPGGLAGGLKREDKRAWPHMRSVFATRFKEKTRSEWEAIFDGTDACATPVLEHQEMENEGYEQRPLVSLTGSPSKAVDAVSVGKSLRPGEGGTEILNEWMNWRRGREYDVVEGVFVKKERGKM